MSGETQSQVAVQSAKKFKFVYRALIIILLLLAAAVAGLIGLINNYTAPVNQLSREEIKVEIPHGASTLQIAKLLSANNLIKDVRFFHYYSRYKGWDRKFKSGEYLLSPAMSFEEIVQRIMNGSVTSYKFTVPEGLTVRQTARLWQEKGFGSEDEFMQSAESDSWGEYFFLKDAPQGEERLEGFLFPETYTIAAGTTSRQIIKLMLDQFQKYFDDEKRQQAEKMGMTVYQAVTLAAIIEKEAKLDEERAIISAVFHNRLKKGMLLQSCATIQYILGEPKAQLLDSDLKIPSHYNTYLHSGLPPGPIASPGIASMDAALNPADVFYLYFLTKGDGSHAFANTLREHNNNKIKYLK